MIRSRSRLAKLALVATCFVFAAPAASTLANWQVPNSVGAVQPVAEYYACEHQALVYVEPEFGVSALNNVYAKPWLHDSTTGKWFTNAWTRVGAGMYNMWTNVKKMPLSMGWEFTMYVNGHWTTPFYEASESIHVPNSYTELSCFYTAGL
jgi:hypothetical protein